MGTPYSEIFNMFLSDITDDDILDYDIEDREEVLNDLLNKAVTRFKACKKDLKDVDSNNEEFNEDLTNEEKFIIATIMRKYWLNNKVYNLNLLKQRMTTREWKTTSQAEHLLRLTDLNRELDKEISRMIVDYATYSYQVGDE